MEETTLFSWFWLVGTDSIIIPLAKANVIILSVIGVVVRWLVKRTPSTEDDALIDSIRAVLPMMKRN